MDEQKQRLINALTKEFHRIGNRDGILMAIKYLETGVYTISDEKIRNFPILDSAINDYQCLLSDYNII